MKSIVRPALTLFALLSLVTGIAYPLFVTGVAQALFPYQANGSLLQRNGQVVGSALIGQHFDLPQYFWGRPSATAPMPYNGGNSMGSNLAPTNPALQDAVRERISAVRAADPGTPRPVPVDLVTASGSGLDPHISPAAAAYQRDRVARARGVAPESLDALIAQHTDARLLGWLGEPRVNVLTLNLALDALAPVPGAR